PAFAAAARLAISLIWPSNGDVSDGYWRRRPRLRTRWTHGGRSGGGVFRVGDAVRGARAPQSSPSSTSSGGAGRAPSRAPAITASIVAADPATPISNV